MTTSQHDQLNTTLDTLQGDIESIRRGNKHMDDATRRKVLKRLDRIQTELNYAAADRIQAYLERQGVSS